MLTGISKVNSVSTRANGGAAGHLHLASYLHAGSTPVDLAVGGYTFGPIQAGAADRHVQERGLHGPRRGRRRPGPGRGRGPRPAREAGQRRGVHHRLLIHPGVRPHGRRSNNDAPYLWLFAMGTGCRRFGECSTTSNESPGPTWAGRFGLFRGDSPAASGGYSRRSTACAGRWRTNPIMVGRVEHRWATVTKP